MKLGTLAAFQQENPFLELFWAKSKQFLEIQGSKCC